MNKELEIKLETNLENFNKLKLIMEKEAKMLKHKIQEDVYYSPKNEDFYNKGDRCLRLRLEEGKKIFSYKQIHEEDLENRYLEEYETEIEDSRNVRKNIKITCF